MPDLVPKVHPLARPADTDDPMEVVATPVLGDPEYMLGCMVEELAWAGLAADEVLGLFRSPAYPVLNELLGHYGEEEVGRRVRELLGNFGGFRVTAHVDDEPDPDLDDGPELIQLTVRRTADGRA
ncbi:MAG: hypothetical protein U0871_03705 [Gemmataceae bacterium]